MIIRTPYKRASSLYNLLLGAIIFLCSLLSLYCESLSFAGSTLVIGVFIYFKSAKGSYYVVFEDKELILKNSFGFKTYRFSYDELAKVIIKKDATYNSRTIELDVHTKYEKSKHFLLGFVRTDLAPLIYEELRKRAIDATNCI